MCQVTESRLVGEEALHASSKRLGKGMGKGQTDSAGPADSRETASSHALVESRAGMFVEWAAVELLRRMTDLGADIQTIHGLYKGTEGQNLVLGIPNLLRFMWTIITKGEIGLGEMYANGEWWMERGSLAAMLTNLARRQNNEGYVQFIKNLFPREWLRKWKQTFRHMTPDTAKDLIQVAYDVDDTLYEAMLDASMTYTSARFLKGDESLLDAQWQKRQMMIEKACLPSNARVVDIGCGWGALCAHVADHIPGAQVTGVSNSPGMVRIATGRNGQRPNVDYQECDYREIDIPDGSVDAVLSVEMIEAIGVNQFDTFAKVCDRLLKPGGRAVIQVITAPAWSNAVARTKKKSNETFVTTYIFPGGQIPHVEFVEEAMAPYFDRVHSESFGHDYARTLAYWRDNLAKNKAAVKCTEAIKRGYDYYLAWCEAGFNTELLNVHQLVFQKRRPTGASTTSIARSCQGA